jgi:hypothetical protein
MSYLFLYFSVKAEIDTETPKTNIKTDINGNKHRPNMARTRAKSG